MADRAASVLARLRNLAAASGRPYHLCLQLFCQEEFLRRLATSEHKNRFVLKGGHLIYCLTNFSSRPTLDIDFLVQNTDNSIEQIEKILADIIHTPGDNDFVSYYNMQASPRPSWNQIPQHARSARRDMPLSKNQRLVCSQGICG